jgi:uncharacterized membrane-anchored protein YjiN (DUF445 family)
LKVPIPPLGLYSTYQMSDTPQPSFEMPAPDAQRRVDKGLWTLLACLLLGAAGLAMRAWQDAPPGLAEAFWTVGMTGAIGAGTNRMAISALFTPWPSRRLALPYTGLVERRRDEIIDAIALTVSGHILTPHSLSEWIRREGFLASIRDSAVGHLEAIASGQVTDPGAIAARKRVLDALRTVLLEELSKREVYASVRAYVRAKAGTAGILGHITGVADYDVVTHQILQAVREKISDVLADNEGAPSAELAVVLRRSAGALRQWNIHAEPAVEQFLTHLVDRFDVGQAVSESLRRYQPSQIRDLVFSLSRDHLGWLEVYGGLFGAAGGVALWLLTW